MTSEQQRCRFFISHKNRLCRFVAIAGKEYCGQHLHLATGEGEKRVPCPFNPKHHVRESDLVKHIKKCTAQLRRQQEERELTYVEDVNRPPSEPPKLPPGSTRSEQRSAYAEILGPERLLDLISKVVQLTAAWAEPELRCSIPDVCQEHLRPDGRRPFKLKHAFQQASIIGHLIDRGVFDGQIPPVVIELGAGKAYLSSMISDVTSARVYVLIDNQAFKLKAERTMRSEAELSVRRLRVDLKDFALNRLPELQSEAAVPWVVVGKHLCGSSTDFAMQAFLQALRGQSHRLCRGLFIATCCHHRCGWESFAAKATFLDLGFSKEEFELISWMTGWALCDHQAAAEKEEVGNLQIDEVRSEMLETRETDQIPDRFWRLFPKDFRVAVGLSCKRLIDQCRRSWLRVDGVETDLCLYVEEDVSPENKLLTGLPRTA